MATTEQWVKERERAAQRAAREAEAAAERANQRVVLDRIWAMSPAARQSLLEERFKGLVGGDSWWDIRSNTGMSEIECREAAALHDFLMGRRS